jgi:hypothetical protein
LVSIGFIGHSFGQVFTFTGAAPRENAPELEKFHFLHRFYIVFNKSQEIINKIKRTLKFIQQSHPAATLAGFQALSRLPARINDVFKARFSILNIL